MTYLHLAFVLFFASSIFALDISHLNELGSSLPSGTEADVFNIAVRNDDTDLIDFNQDGSFKYSSNQVFEKLSIQTFDHRGTRFVEHTLRGEPELALSTFFSAMHPSGLDPNEHPSAAVNLAFIRQELEKLDNLQLFARGTREGSDDFEVVEYHLIGKLGNKLYQACSTKVHT